MFQQDEFNEQINELEPPPSPNEQDRSSSVQAPAFHNEDTHEESGSAHPWTSHDPEEPTIAEADCGALMMTFKDYIKQTEAEHVDRQALTESRSLIRKGAIAGFTSQSIRHSNKAQASFKRSMTALQTAKGKSVEERIDTLYEVLEGALSGLSELTKQLSQTAALSASTALMHERLNSKTASFLKKRTKGPR